jgi:predicted transcriptional regulator
MYTMEIQEKWLECRRRRIYIHALLSVIFFLRERLTHILEHILPNVRIVVQQLRSKLWLSDSAVPQACSTAQESPGENINDHHVS